jgi:EAL domain-containing protein (putative c-di-GMP-specific phosphodiesterase class I)
VLRSAQRHRELGLIYPADFIPLLEDTGLIVPIGEWVLEASCAAASRWQRPGRAPVRVSVNLSAGQFNSPQLVDKVAGALETSGLPSELLDLEITESMLMKHAQQTIDTLTALGAMGVRFAIDDFGTGYSSLSYLKRFPIHVLKIDRSFVRDVPGDPDGTAIIQTIVAMAHNLKLQVVAEGVETEQQAGFLRASGCDAVQGHHYSRALPDDEFARLLDASA